MYSPSNFATVHGKISAASSLRGSVTSQREQFRKPIPFQSPKLPDTAIRRQESLGFDRPSFVYDHSEDQMQKDTILLNYCIDDIETMCRSLRESRSGVGSNGPVRMLEDYKATDFISIFQKFKLAFNLLVSQLESTYLASYRSPKSTLSLRLSICNEPIIMFAHKLTLFPPE